MMWLFADTCLHVPAAAFPACPHTQMVNQRAELFSVFLVIPTGFLRALASKQVRRVCCVCTSG
jgi:hypothetical protein